MLGRRPRRKVSQTTGSAAVIHRGVLANRELTHTGTSGLAIPTAIEYSVV